MNTAAKSEIASGLLAVLSQTRVRGSSAKIETCIGSESWVSSTLPWGSWQVYDRTAVGRLVGLDYFGARYYGSVQGRFTSPDWSETPQPIPYADLSDPQTLNLYTYVRNNPLSRTDPDGHCGYNVACWQQVGEFVVTKGQVVAAGIATGLAAAGAALSNPKVREAINDFVTTGPMNSPMHPVAMAIDESVEGSTGQGQAPPKDVYIDPNKYPAAAGNAEAGQKEGQPDVLTVQRPGTSGRRQQAVSGTPTQAGTDRDEYPPAVTAEGGRGARVRNISSSDNRGAGASVGNQIRDVPNGGKIRIIPKPKPEEQQH